MEHLRNLVNLFADAHPTLKAKEPLFLHIEDVLLPHLLRVIQKDNTLFAEIELFPGIKVDWVPSDDNWRKVHMALLYSVLHGNPKEKFAKIIDTVKGLIPGGSAQADDISKILDDEETHSSMAEIFELVMNTRLISLVGEVVQSLSVADLDINLEDPEQLLNMIKNPQESPVLMELMDRAKQLLDEKVKSGKINPKDLQRDIEMIRAKVQSAFGKYMNEAVLGENAGNTTGNTADQILSNHPDARRARMIARLQKKVQQKTRK